MRQVHVHGVINREGQKKEEEVEKNEKEEELKVWRVVYAWTRCEISKATCLSLILRCLPNSLPFLVSISNPYLLHLPV